jgi:hypothetical protein
MGANAMPDRGTKIATVKVILKDFSEDQPLAPFTRTCETDEEKGRRGCGATLFFYYTAKNRKRMPFDREAVVIGEPYKNGAEPYLFAEIENHSHFGTCPHAEQNRKASAQARKEPRAS